MTIQEIKDFLHGSDSGFNYSGIQIKKVNNAIEIPDKQGKKIPDDYVLKVGINDYIPAVHSSNFPENGEIQPLTAAETIIAYLESINGSVNYSDCYNYFRY
jgi:5'-nucleotidase